jgi:hypothetical protein
MWMNLKNMLSVKNRHKRSYIVCFLLHEMCRVGKFIERTLVFARGWERREWGATA